MADRLSPAKSPASHTRRLRTSVSPRAIALNTIPIFAPLRKPLMEAARSNIDVLVEPQARHYFSSAGETLFLERGGIDAARPDGIHPKCQGAGKASRRRGCRGGRGRTGTPL
jgi:hypothetical protein